MDQPNEFFGYLDWCLVLTFSHIYRIHNPEPPNLTGSGNIPLWRSDTHLPIIDGINVSLMQFSRGVKSSLVSWIVRITNVHRWYRALVKPESVAFGSSRDKGYLLITSGNHIYNPQQDGIVAQWLKSRSHDLEVRVRFQPDARFLKNVRTIELTKLSDSG